MGKALRKAKTRRKKENAMFNPVPEPMKIVYLLECMPRLRRALGNKVHCRQLSSRVAGCGVIKDEGATNRTVFS